MGNHLELPFARGVHAGPPRGRLCLNQTAYELHQLSFGQRPAPDDLVLHHLRTPHEIDTVRPLRAQIDLSHNASDPQFASDEKKETCWA